jgi:hypothetical protein
MRATELFNLCICIGYHYLGPISIDISTFKGKGDIQTHLPYIKKNSLVHFLQCMLYGFCKRGANFFSENVKNVSQKHFASQLL